MDESTRQAHDDALLAEHEARRAVLNLLLACDGPRSWDSVSDAADAAYLAVGKLAALARSASSS